MQDNIITKLFELTDKDTNISFNEPMKRHTTFKIGGPADVFATPDSQTEFVNIIKFCSEHDIPFIVVGNGSNLLISDDGVRGVVISTIKLNSIDVTEDVITSECGAMLSKISHVAEDNSLTGMEFASGIPGTVGGAVVMNAGAYGGEMKDIVIETIYCDKNGNTFRINNSEHNFSYRHSFFSDKEIFVLKTRIQLKKGDRNEISETMKDLTARRNGKQPLNYPSAGSTFKRPEGYFAAKLLEDTGLKGACVGDAQVSEKHAGFVINKGNATAKDVRELIAFCQKSVFDKFGVSLEPEIKFIGEF